MLVQIQRGTRNDFSRGLQLAQDNVSTHLTYNIPISSQNSVLISPTISADTTSFQFWFTHMTRSLKTIAIFHLYVHKCHIFYSAYILLSFSITPNPMAPAAIHRFKFAFQMKISNQAMLINAAVCFGSQAKHSFEHPRMKIME